MSESVTPANAKGVGLRTSEAPFAAADGYAAADCYVGVKPCGCMVAWVFDGPKYPKDVAKSVADFIKSGYRVERANTDSVRRKLGRCKCKPHDQAHSQKGRERGPDNTQD